ncbi:General stress protein 13 [Porphyridium purpureum]|uniref:General stress protein 13 n=1 Tax=Porphyridium purpureum TaxID=35688 RepID=A0A5J4YYF6_PORPP|nr:General stress protein 13 [Porphyridium purpureum]|eukprot:POR0640..scf209_3
MDENEREAPSPRAHNDQPRASGARSKPVAHLKARAPAGSSTPVIHVGEVYRGLCVGHQPYGVFVELVSPLTDNSPCRPPSHLPSREGPVGLVHVSEIRNGFVAHVEDEIKLGEIVHVLVLAKKEGRFTLSMKRVANFIRPLRFGVEWGKVPWRIEGEEHDAVVATDTLEDQNRMEFVKND